MPSSLSSANDDVESQKTTVTIRDIPHWRLVFDQTLITDRVRKHKYRGAGTEESPYLVEFLANDPRNPMDMEHWKKWALTLTVAFATLCVSFASSAFTGGIEQVIVEFRCSTEVATLGLSLFVLGFAIGPLIWVCCWKLLNTGLEY